MSYGHLAKEINTIHTYVYLHIYTWLDAYVLMHIPLGIYMKNYGISEHVGTLNLHLTALDTGKKELKINYPTDNWLLLYIILME